MLRGDNDMTFVLKHYDPTRKEAIVDFTHLYEKLKNGTYGTGEDPQEDFDDWDDDFMFAVRTVWFCIFDNENKEQRERIFKLFVELMVKRCELMKGLEV